MKRNMQPLLLHILLPGIGLLASAKCIPRHSHSSVGLTRSPSSHSLSPTPTSATIDVIASVSEPASTSELASTTVRLSITTESSAAITTDDSHSSTIATKMLEAVSTTATTECGSPKASIVLDEASLLVAADINNQQAMPQGASLCSGYHGTSSSDGDYAVTWSTIFAISDESNRDVYKGYSNVAVTGGDTGINSVLGDFESIPAAWQWSATNSTPWRGNYIFDFVFSPNKGDWSSSAAVELMLYLDYTDDLGFIGEADGVVGTVSLFGLDGWSIYHGRGAGNVWLTTSLVAPRESRYSGSFDGDIMGWVNAVKDTALLSDTMYCTAANAGMEAFYGDITVDHVTSLKINTS